AISNPPKFYFTRKNSFLSLHFFWVRSVYSAQTLGSRKLNFTPGECTIRTGFQWALLHSNRKNLAVTDKIHYKIAIQLLKKKYATKNESQ
ncbi:hypothetical protein, partial [Wolbachia endosymbiont of Nomada ferruginata]